MKKLFTAIRASDLEMVRQIIEKKPELVNCIAKKPPKKDDGQSPLQVALKTGNTAIANYLLDMGADVNFIEDETCCNAWRTPFIWQFRIKPFCTAGKADIAIIQLCGTS